MTTIRPYLPLIMSGLAALLLAVVADTVLRGATRCELSLRALGACAALAGAVGCVLAAFYAQQLAFPLLLLAVGIFASVMTRLGRRVTGMDDFGITTAAGLLDDSVHHHPKGTAQ